MLNWPYKDPNEILDYTLDWSARLGNEDHIVSSSWVSSSTDVTMTQNSFTDTTSVLWLSGGIARKSYKFTNTITTFKGRTMEQTVGLKIDEK